MSAPLSRAALAEASVRLIEQGQTASGAYLAAPGYATYDYCWLRDGAFMAAAMDAFERSRSAGAFHRWVASTVERYRSKVEALERALASGTTDDPLRLLDPRLTLHTRFTAEGHEGTEPWGDFQLDGYGFWLTSLAVHLARTGDSAAPFVDGLRLVRRYLELVWEYPCFDSWEEYPGRRHATTWAAIARGLRVTDGLDGGPASTVPERIVARLGEMATGSGVLPKFVPGEAPVGLPTADHAPASAVAGHERAGRALAPDAIDAGCLLVLGPFGPFADDDPVVAHTLAAVEATLVVEGGVHRYLEDEYYGGGLWVVLAGALAQVQAQRDPARSDAILAWIEAQADELGQLPEQVDSALRYPDARAAWVERWGPPARPLQWSHAMYLLGLDALRSAVS